MKKFNMKNKIFIFTIILILLAPMVLVYHLKTKEPVQRFSYVEFMEKVQKEEVQSISISDSPDLEGVLKNGQNFVTDNPRLDDFKENMLVKNIEVKEEQGQYSSVQIILGLLLIISFATIAVYLSKNNSQQVSKEYDKMSNMDISTEKDSTIRFCNIAGNDEAKENIMELVDFIKNPQKYEKYGARMPKGIILYGPPGTGKTLMAKALASEAGVDFLAVSGSDFVQVYAGLGAGRIRSLFKNAKEKGKCVVFIDEIDAIGKKRDRGNIGGSDESDRTLNALLTEMSGFKGSEGIVVIAATNRLDTLDEALLRPGRFDRQIEIGLPDLNARYEILKLYSKNRPIGETLNLRAFAEQTVYFSGAKLENLMNEAAINAARENADAITEKHMDRAFYTVIAGDEKKDRSNIRSLDRKITAYHEAGHAVVTKLISPENKVTKVTIIPSTKGIGGFSMNIPPDKMYHTKIEMKNNIKIALAGRIVEELVFGSDNVTTGASNDIQKATEILVSMMKHFGMNEEIGMVNYDVLMGSYGSNDHSLVSTVKDEMKKIYDETKKLVEDHKVLIKVLAEELLEKETLSEEEINKCIENTR
ncbi:ATP-dependent metallopeptidase FtsH/Yme1/Tma family protein [Alkaliphilus oremlandii]|uniref:ATP-dependent metalloprotease FtsH n=1 Tax=Alkaliphilus oremlandii (strain OhILAs) TaxID=350688 RepID=A8MF50_ALKOO|nr:FtsH/Yme1/Tma family ATP-dependent metallopeptidase [Alkaliphilus oremlandii]ABW18719.1 ATP-dependent metalloprotease FtsH [Alkaliphilus oremlandii OhILAs]